MTQTTLGCSNVDGTIRYLGADIDGELELAGRAVFTVDSASRQVPFYGDPLKGAVFQT